MHRLEIQSFSCDSWGAFVFLNQLFKSITISLRSSNYPFLIALGLFNQAKSCTSRPRNNIIGIRLTFVFCFFCILSRFYRVAKGSLNLLWRLNILDGEIYNSNPRFVTIGYFLRDIQCFSAYSLFVFIKDLVGNASTNNLSHGCFSSLSNNIIRPYIVEHIGLRISYSVLHSKLYVNDIFITRQHKRVSSRSLSLITSDTDCGLPQLCEIYNLVRIHRIWDSPVKTSIGRIFIFSKT